MAAAPLKAVAEPSEGIPPEKLEELRAKHRELFQFTQGDVTVVATPPNRHLWKRFRTQMMDDRRQSDAMENLVRDCVLYPDRAAFEAILERRPGLVEAFGKQLQELAGAGGEVEKKAL
jgi:hypothetical protein